MQIKIQLHYCICYDKIFKTRSLDLRLDTFEYAWMILKLEYFSYKGRIIFL
jgi:hypothetical protein